MKNVNTKEKHLTLKLQEGTAVIMRTWDYFNQTIKELCLPVLYMYKQEIQKFITIRTKYFSSQPVQ